MDSIGWSSIDIERAKLRKSSLRHPRPGIRTGPGRSQSPYWRCSHRGRLKAQFFSAIAVTSTG